MALVKYTQIPMTFYPDVGEQYGKIQLVSVLCNTIVWNQTDNFTV